MMQDLAFDVVELAPCPGSGGAPWPVEIPQLREVAYRWDGWSSEEVDRLHAGFVADAGLGALALEIGRPLHGVRSKIQELGWRRNSRRPWCELEDAYLAQHYGTDAASTIAGALGRSAGAVSARASLLGLTEEQAPPYTGWEITQIREGYAQGVPVAQLGILIGRTPAGLATIAGRLGIRHANGPADWSPEEQARAMELAHGGMRYAAIATTMLEEGHPRRNGKGAVGQMLRKLGYARGWGRPWLAEEENLVRKAYHYSCKIRGAGSAFLCDRECMDDGCLNGDDAGTVGVVAAGCQSTDTPVVHPSARGGVGGPFPGRPAGAGAA